MITKSTLADTGFENLSRFAAIFVFLLLAAILVSLGYESRDTINQYRLSFLTSSEWDPVQDIYGALSPILGTLITSAIALLIAVPGSFGIAVYLTELAPVWIRKPCSIAIELLAAVPSISYGMWGRFVFAPLFQTYVGTVADRRPGFSPRDREVLLRRSVRYRSFHGRPRPLHHGDSVYRLHHEGSV